MIQTIYGTVACITAVFAVKPGNLNKRVKTIKQLRLFNTTKFRLYVTLAGNNLLRLKK